MIEPVQRKPRDPWKKLREKYSVLGYKIYKLRGDESYSVLDARTKKHVCTRFLTYKELEEKYRELLAGVPQGDA